MITEFIDRESELAFLDQSWQERQAQLIVLLGRRRVGKTALLRHLADRRPLIHYVATRLPEAQQLAELGAVMGQAMGDPLLKENGFRNWEQVFTVLGRGRSSAALALDEFPYLVEANPALPSLLQRAWDRELAESDAWLALCGSAVAMMERETLDARAPLYGRRTGQLRLAPLGFDAACQFLPGYSFEECFRAYAVFGGIPQYLQMLDPKRGLLENISRLVLAPGAPLHDEVEYLLRLELVETRVYFGILAAVAAGKRKLSEIVNATQIPSSNISKYLGVLQTLGLIVREVPASERRPEKSKKGLYRIADPFVRFWFRHVLPAWTRLEAGHESAVLADISKDLDHLAAESYEEEIRRLVLQRGLGGRTWRRAGRWWNRHDELDVLASDDEGAVLVGEAKWSVNPVGVDVLRHVEEKAHRTGVTQDAEHVVFALFSRSGFTREILETERPDLILVHGLDPQTNQT
jgi:AAA+ ATPase superfamily predicted ATPase